MKCSNRYLGDGVYASFDGMRIWLAVNHHTNQVVALEPEVCTALYRYIKDINAEQVARETTATNTPLGQLVDEDNE